MNLSIAKERLAAVVKPDSVTTSQLSLIHI